MYMFPFVVMVFCGGLYSIVIILGFVVGGIVMVNWFSVIEACPFRVFVTILHVLLNVWSIHVACCFMNWLIRVRFFTVTMNMGVYYR